jgi:hypothetical protein
MSYRIRPDSPVPKNVRRLAEPAPAFRKRLGGYWAALQTLGRERPAGEIGDLASEPADRPPHAADLLSAAAR